MSLYVPGKGRTVNYLEGSPPGSAFQPGQAQSQQSPYAESTPYAAHAPAGSNAGQQQNALSMSAWAMPKQQLLQWGQMQPQVPALQPQQGMTPAQTWDTISGVIGQVNNTAANQQVGTYLGSGAPPAGWGQTNYNPQQLWSQATDMVSQGWRNPFSPQSPAAGTRIRNLLAQPQMPSQVSDWVQSQAGKFYGGGGSPMPPDVRQAYDQWHNAANTGTYSGSAALQPGGTWDSGPVPGTQMYRPAINQSPYGQPAGTSSSPTQRQARSRQRARGGGSPYGSGPGYYSPMPAGTPQGLAPFFDQARQMDPNANPFQQRELAYQLRNMQQAQEQQQRQAVTDQANAAWMNDQAQASARQAGREQRSADANQRAQQKRRGQARQNASNYQRQRQAHLGMKPKR